VSRDGGTDARGRVSGTFYLEDLICDGYFGVPRCGEGVTRMRWPCGPSLPMESEKSFFLLLSLLLLLSSHFDVWKGEGEGYCGFGACRSNWDSCSG
jgi:hypothetical protein